MIEKRSGSQPGELFWEEEVWSFGNRLRSFGGEKITTSVESICDDLSPLTVSVKD